MKNVQTDRSPCQVRVFSAFVRHFQSSPQQLTPNWDSTTIFQPLITRTHAPLLEIDYFMHKSNSTYYSDLDVSRAHLLLALFQRGLARIKLADDGTHAGRLAIMLGAVHCSFRREIKPYQPYEIWSRVLCWDRKWLYIVTHFVEQGAVVPSGYTLQPPWYGKSNWFRSLLPLSRKRKEDGEAKTNSSRLNGKVDSVHPSVFATAISKCVLKKGRRTISPECLLVASGLLPPPPPECDDNAGLTAWTLAPECAGDWAAVEQERQRGMQFAQHFTQLDSLHGEFGAGSRMALGAYGDLLP